MPWRIPTKNYALPVANWEHVADSGAQSYNIGMSMSTATVQYDIQQGLLADAIKGILGYATAGAASINRVLPIKHPILGAMYASKIVSIDPIAVGKGQFTGDKALTGAYQFMRLTVQFETPPYKIEPDSKTDPEYKRFFQFVGAETKTEFLQRKEATFAWPNYGAIYLAAQTPATGKAAPIGITEVFGNQHRVVKTQYTFMWVQVPDAYLFSGGFDGGGRATNLEACLGTVNNAIFRNYERHTLLFDHYVPTPRTQPLLTTGDVTANRTWDVMMKFTYFDPPASAKGALPPSGIALNGHQLVPSPTDNKWYRPLLLSKFTGLGADAPGNWLYNESDFLNMFKEAT